jgi:hypothetical protein
MNDLHNALRNIHADPFWWRKVLICGAYMLTVLGAPWAAGLVVESMDNVRRGYPTPLPPRNDWWTRFIIGFFAIILDFFYFVFPILLIGLVTVCVLLAFLLVQFDPIQYATLIQLGIVILVVAYLVFAFAIGIAPISRLLYIKEGSIENVLGTRLFGVALHSRKAYVRARLLSLPAYVPALLLAAITWLSIGNTLPGGIIVTIGLLWLTLSALTYAHLVVVQLYGTATRSTQAML